MSWLGQSVCPTKGISPMITRLILVLCVVVSSVLAVPSAMAATFSLDHSTLVYTAAAGEVNSVVMTDGPVDPDDVKHYVVLTDTGAGTITDTSGRCTVVGSSATCLLFDRNAPAFIVKLGDEDDSYRAASCSSCVRRFVFCYHNIANPWMVRGGDGNDTLVGSPGDDCLFGDAGNDVIRGLAGGGAIVGGAGNDLMFGGTGHDAFIADATRDGSDTMIGGTGADTAYYWGRSRAVSLTLDGRRNDGEPGEHDQLVHVSRLHGGKGNDTLIGNSVTNWLRGGAGDDLLDSGAGDDAIDGGPGADLIVGGAGYDNLAGFGGNDTFKAVDSKIDLVSGGAGKDMCFCDAKRPPFDFWPYTNDTLPDQITHVESWTTGHRCYEEPRFGWGYLCI